MDWTSIVSNFITQVIVLIVGIPTLIIQLYKLHLELKQKEMNNTKEQHYKESVIHMIKNGIIKIDPQTAQELILKLLDGTIDSETAVEQIKEQTNEKISNKTNN